MGSPESLLGGLQHLRNIQLLNYADMADLTSYNTDTCVIR